MLKLLPKDTRALLRAALGEIESDTVFTNARIVNVFTGEVLPGDVYVYDGFIAHVEYKNPGVIDVPVKEKVDCRGMYLIPGLIDAHMHIESTMLTPRNFAKPSSPREQQPSSPILMRSATSSASKASNICMKAPKGCRCVS